MHRILDFLDEDDDVQNVYHNWDESEEDYKLLTNRINAGFVELGCTA